MEYFIEGTEEIILILVALIETNYDAAYNY